MVLLVIFTKVGFRANLISFAIFTFAINHMKHLFAIFLFCLSIHSFAQNPFKNREWSGNHLVGVNDFFTFYAYDSLRLEKLDRKHLYEKNPYGYITTFKENTFTSYNQGWCGTECRVLVTGTYKVQGKKIEFFIETIHHMVICAREPDDNIQQSLGIFSWKRQGKGYLIYRER